MSRHSFLAQGGTFVQKEDSVCYVSYWNIPNGSDYHRAEVLKVFFADKEVANKLATKYSAPPEMAFVVSLT